VILTAPWPEAAPLVNPWLHTLDESERQRLQGIRYAPCLGLELVLEGNPQVSAPGLVFMPYAEVACVADQGAKGLRGGQGGLVMLCSPEYSERRFKESDAILLPDLLALAQPWLGSVAIKSVRISRWHHARVTQAFGSPYLALPTPAPLVLCGDGFAGPRIEAAFTSGWQAGVEVKRILGGK
jgi:predicted NAD/FAD-dependent oxidoreductase